MMKIINAVIDFFADWKARRAQAREKKRRIKEAEYRARLERKP